MKIFNIFKLKSEQTKGVVLYLISIVFLTCLITTFKKIAIKYQTPISEIIFIRQIVIVACLMPIMIKDKFNFFDKKAFKPNVIRNVLFGISTLIMYTGMKYVPINDGSVIMFMAPISASIMAVVILKEKVSKKLWIGLFFCFIGIIIIKKPSLDLFSTKNMASFGYSLLLIAALMRGYIAILNKKLTQHFSVMQMLYYTNIVMIFVGLSGFWKFKPIPLEAAPLFIIISIGFFCEYFFVYAAYKRCSVSMLQPMDSLKLVFSAGFSYFILDEKVSTNQIIGGALVVIAYLYTLPRKKKL